MNLLQESKAWRRTLEEGLAQACSLPDLEELRVVLGRKGVGRDHVPPALPCARRAARLRKVANEVKDKLTALFEARKNVLEEAFREK